MQQPTPHPPIRLPAEWEPHRGTLLAWPHNKNDWPGKFQAIPWVFGEIIRHLTPGEPVWLFVQSEAHQRRVARLLARVGVDVARVEFLMAPTDRGWMRDCSPAFIARAGQGAAVQFAFNAWAKYEDYHRDAALPPLIAQRLGWPLAPAEHDGRHVVLEGGAIDKNGAGTLLTTEECLLDPATQVRNPGFGKADYARVFREHLGITNVIWLGKGIAGDDTHGHVDDLCRFVGRDTMVLCREENPQDANYAALKENWERLEQARLEDGSRPQVIALPMPAPLYFEGVRLPASYANFYIANEAVLVPTFNDPSDRHALGILAECFPTRRVVGIHAVDLVWGFGTVHCLSHEIPAQTPPIEPGT